MSKFETRWMTILGFSVSTVLSGCTASGKVDSPQKSPSALVLSGPLTLEMEESAKARDAEICKRWTYDANQLDADFPRLREVDSSSWGRRCYTFACSYKGKATYEGASYDLNVNAGGWVTLSPLASSRARYFVSDEKEPSFVEACNCCEE